MMRVAVDGQMKRQRAGRPTTTTSSCFVVRGVGGPSLCTSNQIRRRMHARIDRWRVKGFCELSISPRWPAATRLGARGELAVRGSSVSGLCWE